MFINAVSRTRGAKFEVGVEEFTDCLKYLNELLEKEGFTPKTQRLAEQFSRCLNIAEPLNDISRVAMVSLKDYQNIMSNYGLSDTRDDYRKSVYVEPIRTAEAPVKLKMILKDGDSY